MVTGVYDNIISEAPKYYPVLEESDKLTPAPQHILFLGDVPEVFLDKI